MVDERQIRLQASGTKTDLVAHAPAALRELVLARDCARDVKSDPWDFAVEIADLMALGIGRSGLRWLVRKSYADHSREVTRPGDVVRRFEPELSLAFRSETCFVLTDAGYLWQAAQASPPVALRLHEEPAAASVVAAPVIAAPVPHWDRRKRTLYFCGRVVRRYRVPAGNQETVLAAFEESGWTHDIDDPLRPLANVCPGVRLRDTLRRLNAHQTNHLLQFSGDGTGNHILWEMVSEATLPLEAARRQTRKAA